MEADKIIELVNGVGFPLVLCVALLWINKTNTTLQKDLMDSLKDSIEETNKVLEELANKIKGGK